MTGADAREGSVLKEAEGEQDEDSDLSEMKFIAHMDRDLGCFSAKSFYGQRTTKERNLSVVGKLPS